MAAKGVEFFFRLIPIALCPRIHPHHDAFTSATATFRGPGVVKNGFGD